MASKLGPAGRPRTTLLAAGNLSVNALNGFKKYSHFFHGACVVLNSLGTAWLPFSADLALMTRADILGPVVKLALADG